MIGIYSHQETRTVTRAALLSTDWSRLAPGQTTCVAIRVSMKKKAIFLLSEIPIRNRLLADHRESDFAERGESTNMFIVPRRRP